MRIMRTRTSTRSSGRLGDIDRSTRRRRLSSGLRLIAALSVLSVIAVGCSSSKKTTGTVPGSTNLGVITPTTSAPSPTTAAATGGLSGTWTGQYTGADQGTFTLSWQQSGSNLTGTIKLSAPSVTDDISGTVQGGTISFGTLGGEATTYSGSVSGNTMSGTYKAPNGSGSWSATKAS
jgi:hypothetical protein